jgi:hypothetical protein
MILRCPFEQAIAGDFSGRDLNRIEYISEANNLPLHGLLLPGIISGGPAERFTHMVEGIP